jgi:hypothetical protein
MKRFPLSLVAIIALSGAILVAHSNPAAAMPPDPCTEGFGE